MDYLLVISGLILLLISGDFLVKSAVSLSGYFRISPLIIGVVVVSFGTSAPELMVSINASLQGYPDIAMGNVIGSNIANVALVLGITAAIKPVFMNRQSVTKDLPLMLIFSFLFFFLILDSKLMRWEAGILLLILFSYLFISIKKSRASFVEEDVPIIQWKPAIALPVTLVSCVGLMYGAQWLITGASSIASNFGVSERVIAITVIAFGTSLPELATSAVAAVKGEMDISIGNIIGSNIFNLLGVLGVTGMLRPMLIDPMLTIDAIFMLGFSVLLLVFALVPYKNPCISRWKGLFFLVAYGFYIVFLVF